MMGFMALLIVAGGSSFAIIWLLNYVPLVAKVPLSKNVWSPKLFIAEKILGPMDAGVTLILVGGGWVGFTSAMGISAMVYNVLSGIGLSIGVMITKKYFTPRWKKQYAEKRLEAENNVLI